MPSVSVITTGLHSNKSYAPLADEVNPPFGHVAPSPTSVNGSIVYSKRISTPIGSIDEHADASSSRVLSPTDDTVRHQYPAGTGGGGVNNNRSGSSSASGRVSRGGGRWSPTSRSLEEDGHGDGDIGVRRYKGKERARDNGAYHGYDETTGDGSTSSYPPVNDAEEEEKRVQANLAKFAARENVRRKAARLSRAGPSSTGSDSAGSSTTSLSRSGGHGARPMSYISDSISSVKRSSLLGFIGGKDKRVPEDIELPASPTTAIGSNSGHGHSSGHGHGNNNGSAEYSNPYDPVPRQQRAPTSPTMSRHGPFADPPGVDSQRPRHGRADSSAPLQGSLGEGEIGYVGAGWRGGGAVAGSQSTASASSRSKPERWWHALCAWGSDLDGGHGKGTSNQAGRTNPFE